VTDDVKERVDETEEILQAASGDSEIEASDTGETEQSTLAEAPEDDAFDIQEEIERLKAEAAANLDGWQRALAEFNNYKKRREAERSKLVFLTGVKIIEKLLPVIDDFDRALANSPDDSVDNGWIEGVRITRRKLVDILESEGLSLISVAPGDAFDPEIHEAVTHEESDDFSEGQIIAEIQTGYRIGDRLLRPSSVRVAR